MNAVERFLQYVGFDTQSDEESESFPSADREKLLAAALAEELRELGLADAWALRVEAAFGPALWAEAAFPHWLDAWAERKGLF